MFSNYFFSKQFYSDYYVHQKSASFIIMLSNAYSFILFNKISEHSSKENFAVSRIRS